MAKYILSLVLLVAAISACLCNTEFSHKITPDLQRSLETKGHANIFVHAKNSRASILNSISLKSFTDRTARINDVFKSLTTHAEDSQKEVLQLLTSSKVQASKVKLFWINNQVYVQDADVQLVESIAALESVTMVEEEDVIHLQPPKTLASGLPKRSTILAPEWNLVKMRVPEVWSASWGNNGSGVLVGVIDTGVRASHEAIRDRYVNDGRSWRDPYNQYFVPTDIYDHGTHCTGSVLGRDGIGVAPEARFIACKGYRDDGTALVSAFFECGQFLVCPTDENGNNPDCSRAVHVAQNSWGLALGGGDYSSVLDVWDTVGIKPIFANGNYGPTCGLVYSPADNVRAIGIGATDSNDRLASYSGRGPSVFGVLKPDVSAPGSQIYSCDSRSDTTYSIKSGTSMASPNAAGVAALMVGSNPNLSNDQLRSALESTATRNVPALGQSCGGVSDSVWPNNAYGHGRIDAYAAMERVARLKSL